MSENLMSHNFMHRSSLFESTVLVSFTAALVGGIAAVALSIIGLANYAPPVMAAVGALVLGTAFALNGGLLAVEHSRMRAQSHPTRGEAAEYVGGVSVETVTGVAAIVLSILALLKIDIAALIPVAALVLAIGTIFGSGVLAWLNGVSVSQPVETNAERVTYGILAFATGIQVLSGVGAVVLSILALIGYSPLALSLVALLALGAAQVLSGASGAGRTIHGIRGSQTA